MFLVYLTKLQNYSTLLNKFLTMSDKQNAAQQITSYRSRLLPDRVNKIMVVKGNI
jgi:hypothetical protein